MGSDEEIIERAIRNALREPVTPEKWHLEKRGTHGADFFEVPKGRVYEVYFGLDGSAVNAEAEIDLLVKPAGKESTIATTSGIVIWCQNSIFPEVLFCPFHMVGNVMWGFDKIVPATGIVEYGGSQVDGTNNVINNWISPQTDAQGYILTEGMQFMDVAMGLGAGFFVMWRDVTKIRGKGY